MAIRRRRPGVTARAVLPVADLARAEAFHVALGFDVERHDDRYAWVRFEGDEIYHLAVVDDLDVESNAAAVFLFVRDLSAWHDRASAAAGDAGTDVTAITEQPWGMREFVVHDPASNRVRLGWFT